MRLADTMETTFSAGHRVLPPAPRAAPAVESTLIASTPSERTPTATPPLRRMEHRPLRAADDEAQEFVARVRACAVAFAASASAQTAVVKEVVPPARHRRSRCRIVLRQRGGAMADLTFVGSAGQPELEFPTWVQRWLESGQPREDAWVLPDDEAADGVAIDLTAWLRLR